MVEPHQIEEWKRQFGRIYQIDKYIFRGITINEWKFIHSLGLSSAEVEERIVAVVVLHPLDIDLDSMPAGVVSEIAERVSDLSGWGDPKAARVFLEQKRDESQHVVTLMKAMVLAAMPVYTEEELDDLVIPRLMEKVVLAEEILKIQKTIYDPQVSPPQLELIDPEEEAAKQAAAAQKHTAKRKAGQAVYNDPIADKLRRSMPQ